MHGSFYKTIVVKTNNSKLDKHQEPIFTNNRNFEI